MWERFGEICGDVWRCVEIWGRCVGVVGRCVGDVWRYGEMCRDVGEMCGDVWRYEDMWGDVGKCVEMCGDMRRCGDMWRRVEMWGDMRRRGGVAPEASLSPLELFCSRNRESEA